jgi:hypothetical protein
MDFGKNALKSGIWKKIAFAFSLNLSHHKINLNYVAIRYL